MGTGFLFTLDPRHQVKLLEPKILPLIIWFATNKMDQMDGYEEQSFSFEWVLSVLVIKDFEYLLNTTWKQYKQS